MRPVIAEVAILEASAKDSSVNRKPPAPSFFHCGLFSLLPGSLITLILFVSVASAGPVISFVMWKPNQPELWNEVIATFQEETGIRVSREIGPHSSTAAHALLSQKLKNRDSSLDVFMMDVIWPPEFASAGWVLPLDRFFPAEDRRDFFPGTIAACTFLGKIYGVPFWTSGGLLYYRKDLLKKYGFDPPKTWPDLVRQAETIVNGEKAENPALKGYSGQFKQYEGLVCDMQEFILSNRGTILSAQSGKSTLAAPKTLEAIRFVRDRLIGPVAPRGVLTYEEPESLHLFIQGHAVFHRNWPYAWEISNNPDKSRVAGKVGITVLPHFRGGTSSSTLGGWQFAISRFSKRKEAAWKFVRFMTSERIQKVFAVRASQAAARRSVYKDPEVLKINPHFEQLMMVFENAAPRPPIAVYPLYSNILQRFYHRAISFSDSSIKALANQADEKVEGLLKLMKEAGM